MAIPFHSIKITLFQFVQNIVGITIGSNIFNVSCGYYEWKIGSQLHLDLHPFTDSALLPLDLLVFQRDRSSSNGIACLPTGSLVFQRDRLSSNGIARLPQIQLCFHWICSSSNGIACLPQIQLCFYWICSSSNGICSSSNGIACLPLDLLVFHIQLCFHESGWFPLDLLGFLHG